MLSAGTVAAPMTFREELAELHKAWAAFVAELRKPFLDLARRLRLR